MKHLILAAIICVSFNAMAQQTPDSLKTDKGRKEQSRDDKKDKKPKEKKERKMWLIGVEASRGNYRYNVEYPQSDGSIYKSLLDKDSPFFNYFGNTKTIYSGNTFNNWNYNSRQVDFTTTWGFGKKGDVRQRHVVKFGAGFSSRGYPTTMYSALQYSQRDTTGYTYVGNDTVAFIKDTSSYYFATILSSVKMGHVNVAYAYRLFPLEKLSLSLGGGVDIGMGEITVKGDADFNARSTTYGQSISGQGWSYNNYEDHNSKVQEVFVIEEKRFKAFVFRPYLSARVDYRLSKNFPLLKHINLFTEGRFGVEFANLNKKFYDGPPPTFAVRIGVSYTFFKGL